MIPTRACLRTEHVERLTATTILCIEFMIRLQQDCHTTHGSWSVITSGIQLLRIYDEYEFTFSIQPQTEIPGLHLRGVTVKGLRQRVVERD